MNTFVRTVCFLFLAAGLLFWRLSGVFALPANHVSNFFGDVSLRGCIVDYPDVRAGTVKYVFEVEKVGEIAGSGRVLLVNEKYPAFEYGDCLLVSGEFVEPVKFDGFDYGKYLLKDGIYGLIYRPQISKIGEFHGFYSFVL